MAIDQGKHPEAKARVVVVSFCNSRKAQIRKQANVAPSSVEEPFHQSICTVIIRLPLAAASKSGAVHPAPSSLPSDFRSLSQTGNLASYESFLPNLHVSANWGGSVEQLPPLDLISSPFPIETVHLPFADSIGEAQLHPLSHFPTASAFQERKQSAQLLSFGPNSPDVHRIAPLSLVYWQFVPPSPAGESIASQRCSVVYLESNR